MSGGQISGHGPGGGRGPCHQHFRRPFHPTQVTSTRMRVGQQSTLAHVIQFSEKCDSSAHVQGGETEAQRSPTAGRTRCLDRWALPVAAFHHQGLLSS